MKITTYILTSLVALCFTSTSFAGTGTGRILNIGTNFGGIVRIKLESTDNIADCGAGYSGFSIDANTEGGRALYSLAISDQAQDKPVNVGGRAIYDERNDTESLQWLTLPTG